MRLAIVNLTGGGFSGGYRKYLKNVLPRLAGHHDVEALLCVSPEGSDVSGWLEKPTSADYCACSPLMLKHLVYRPDKKLAGCLKQFSPDVIFMPIERYVEFDNVPVVNMVRNMEPFIPSRKGYPLREMLRLLIQRKLACRSVKRADHTIAVSNFVRDYLTATLHFPENKISQVYHGVNQQTSVSCKRPPAVPNEWDGEFLFTCGSVRPARGLEDALEALNDLKARDLDMPLVIAGGIAPGMRRYRDGLGRFLASRGLADRVSWTGDLNDEEMRWCYERCRLFIMTSRIEACPNIALEAMSFGAVSIAANNPPLPEFFSDCAAYYKAGNGRSLAEAIMDRIALDRREISSLSERAQKRSAMFSWDLTADKTMNVLMQILIQSKTHNKP